MPMKHSIGQQKRLVDSASITPRSNQGLTWRSCGHLVFQLCDCSPVLGFREHTYLRSCSSIASQNQILAGTLSWLVGNICNSLSIDPRSPTGASCRTIFGFACVGDLSSLESLRNMPTFMNCLRISFLFGCCLRASANQIRVYLIPGRGALGK